MHISLGVPITPEMHISLGVHLPAAAILDYKCSLIMP